MNPKEINWDKVCGSCSFERRNGHAHGCAFYGTELADWQIPKDTNLRNSIRNVREKLEALKYGHDPQNKKCKWNTHKEGTEKDCSCSKSDMKKKKIIDEDLELPDENDESDLEDLEDWDEGEEL